MYADSTVVVGTLAERAEPHSYDLCADHAQRFSAPRGWEVVHVRQEFVDASPSADDLDALARAVREAGRPASAPVATDDGAGPARASEPRRGHLRVISDA